MKNEKTNGYDIKFDGVDLGVVMERVAKENPKLTSEELTKMEKDYRLFLSEAARLPGQSLRPTKNVDLVWHNHILFTKKYAQDCQQFAGRFLHHRPMSADGNSEENAAGCSSECGIGAGCVT